MFGGEKKSPECFVTLLHFSLQDERVERKGNIYKTTLLTLTFNLVRLVVILMMLFWELTGNW